MGVHRLAVGAVLFSALVVSGSGRATAAPSEDDLAVVRRAVAEATPLVPPARETAAAASRDHRKPQWLRIRVTEKTGDRSRVSVNLPLSVARVLGEQRFSVNGASRLRVSDVLDALEAGRDLVTVEDDEASVRIWID